MAFNISDFISELNANGVAHNSHFDVLITLPNVLLGKTVSNESGSISFTDQAKMLQLRAESIVEPGIALRSTAINRHGVGLFEKVPFSTAFTDTNITFISDNKSNVQLFWYSWLNLINNFSDTNETYGSDFKQYTVNYKEDIVSTIAINKYNMAGDLIYTLNLNNAFPTSMNDNLLNWGDNNLSKCIVGITFKDWSYSNTQITTS